MVKDSAGTLLRTHPLSQRLTLAYGAEPTLKNSGYATALKGYTGALFAYSVTTKSVTTVEREQLFVLSHSFGRTAI